MRRVGVGGESYMQSSHVVDFSRGEQKTLWLLGLESPSKRILPVKNNLDLRLPLSKRQEGRAPGDP